MKGRRKKGIAAVFMAALMLIGLVPSDFTLVSAKAADKTYILNANDLTAGAEYGAAGNSFLRLNAACTKKNLQDGLQRLKVGIRGFKEC